MDYSFIREFLIKFYDKILVITGILVLTYVIEKIVRNLLAKAFESSSKILKVNHTQYAILRHIVSAIIYVIGVGAALFTIPAIKALSISVFAGAGILAVVIGFASQEALSNIVSGIFIAIFQPFRVGDSIKFDAYSGVVEDITLRHTIIKSLENKRIIVPNSTIGKATLENANLSDTRICKFIDVGIGYDSDIDTAMKIIQDEAMKHPLCIDARTREQKEAGDPVVTVRVTGLGESSVDLRASVWAQTNGDAVRIASDLYKNIKERFDREGIEIPYPYRTVIYKTVPKKKAPAKNIAAKKGTAKIAKKQSARKRG